MIFIVKVSMLSPFPSKIGLNLKVSPHVNLTFGVMKQKLFVTGYKAGYTAIKRLAKQKLYYTVNSLDYQKLGLYSNHIALSKLLNDYGKVNFLYRDPEQRLLSGIVEAVIRNKTNEHPTINLYDGLQEFKFTALYDRVDKDPYIKRPEIWKKFIKEEDRVKFWVDVLNNYFLRMTLIDPHLQVYCQGMYFFKTIFKTVELCPYKLEKLHIPEERRAEILHSNSQYYPDIVKALNHKDLHSKVKRDIEEYIKTEKKFLNLILNSDLI